MRATRAPGEYRDESLFRFEYYFLEWGVILLVTEVDRKIMVTDSGQDNHELSVGPVFSLFGPGCPGRAGSTKKHIGFAEFLSKDNQK